MRRRRGRRGGLRGGRLVDGDRVDLNRLGLLDGLRLDIGVFRVSASGENVDLERSVAVLVPFQR